MADSDVKKLTRFNTLPRRTVLAGVMAMAMSSTALAETCTLSNFTYPGGVIDGVISSAVSSVAGNLISAIVTAQTAFFLQSTAFVSNPGNPAPDQQGSGVWMRGVAGQVDIKNPSQHFVSSNTPTNALLTGTGNIACDTKVSATFGGVQFGHDVAKLNYNGWNIHFGTTAGYIESRGNTSGGIGNFNGDVQGVPFSASFNGTLTNSVRSPFAGTYVAVSKGGFFADAMLRFEHYEASVNSAFLGILNQNVNARGVTFATSAGYHHVMQNGWFVEPSAGVIVSRTKIDDFNLGGANFISAFGRIAFDDIDTVIGRAGVRVGTTFTGGQWVWTPFAAASVWHDFGKAPTANFNSGPAVFLGEDNVATMAYTGSTVGTYGQFSAGASAQLAGTGWVSFARVDYRTGNRLEGWNGTGGVRYHFTPEPAVALVGKSPVYKAAPAVVARSWTGAYMGASAGAIFARDRQVADAEDFDPLGRDLTSRFATPTVHGSGIMYGGQFGYNWQFNPQWVGGIEGAGHLTNLSGDRQCSPTLLQEPTDPNFGNIANPLQDFTCGYSARWLATLTGRLGYVWGRSLWYVKGGGAWTRQQLRITDNALVFVPEFATIDRFGFTAGYGVEFALTDRWSARAETNYYGFGSRSAILSDGTLVTSKLDAISTLIGVNYKLTDR
jgi:opacity protein-like surface antigen